ncbi:hypothetical protein ACFSJQ_06375 [Vibrio olivae]
MSSKTFKLSAIAATVFTALSANAAIYNVTQYAPEGTNVDTYGVAIQQSASGESCWDSGSTCPTSDVIAETQRTHKVSITVMKRRFSYVMGLIILMMAKMVLKPIVIASSVTLIQFVMIGQVSSGKAIPMSAQGIMTT